jgi:ABC-2 type transport system ATP-binding protein
MTMHAVSFKNATKVVASGFLLRPRRIIDGVSFSVERGQVHGLVGHNGAGKSTSLRLLTGCSRPTNGSVALFGGDPTDATVRRHLGFAPDLAVLPQNLCAAEVVDFVAAGRRLGRVDSKAVVERVGLDLRRDPLRTYSKGMLQRLSLALAILGDPELWVLDEPMSGLDPQGRELVRQLLTEHRLRGGTVLFSSHSLADVEALCEQLTVLDGGRVVYTGAVRDFVGRPEFEVEFVGEVPSVGGRRGVHGTVVVVSADDLNGLLARCPEAQVHSVFARVPDLAARISAFRDER